MAIDKCKHEGCKCQVTGPKEYCSEGCKRGLGCDHDDCECDQGNGLDAAGYE
jgi:hypothetical protein